MKTMNYQEELIKIKVLNQRLIQAHPSKDKIFMEYRKKRTGVIGEREVAYRLQFLNPTKFIVLHDLRFVDHNGFFQIDKLILCTKCIFVVEVKKTGMGPLFLVRMDKLPELVITKKRKAFPIQ